MENYTIEYPSNIAGRQLHIVYKLCSLVANRTIYLWEKPILEIFYVLFTIYFLVKVLQISAVKNLSLHFR